MTLEKFTNAAQQFLARRVSGTKAYSLAEALTPRSIDEALSIQQAIIKLRPDNVSGWKCLLPLAEDKLIIAPIFSETMQEGEQCWLMQDNSKVRIEPEIAFVLAHDLPARDEGYSEAEINAAIGSCHMALELIQSRFADDSDVTFPERLADCLVNQGLFLGPTIDKSVAFSADKFQISIKQYEESGEVNEQIFNGVHPNPLPQLPVYWAINYMTKRGTSFKKGEAFTTGSYAGVVELDFDKNTDIDYAGVGSFKVVFKELF